MYTFPRFSMGSIETLILVLGLSDSIAEARGSSKTYPAVDSRNSIPWHTPSRFWTGKMGRNDSPVHRRTETDEF